MLDDFALACPTNQANLCFSPLCTESTLNYAALDGLLEGRGLAPYFPLAYARSREEPLVFDFNMAVLDQLSLPRSLAPDRSSPEDDEDQPVVFRDAAEAVRYLRQKTAGWESVERTAQPSSSQEPRGAPLSLRGLFEEEGTALAPMLASGIASLDQNLQEVRLDRSVACTTHGKCWNSLLFVV